MGIIFGRYQIDVLKDDIVIYREDFPPGLGSEILPMEMGLVPFEEAYASLEDYIESKFEETITDISKKYPEITILVRTIRCELDSIRYDFYKNGKTCRREVSIEFPKVSEGDFK